MRNGWTGAPIERLLHGGELGHARPHSVFDPIVEGKALGLGAKVSLEIWLRAREEARRRDGVVDDDRARQRFLELARRFAASRRVPCAEPGRRTLDDVEATERDVFAIPSPGADTEVRANERRWELRLRGTDEATVDTDPPHDAALEHRGLAVVPNLPTTARGALPGTNTATLSMTPQRAGQPTRTLRALFGGPAPAPSARLAARGRDGQPHGASRELLEQVLALLDTGDHGAPLPSELAARMTADLTGGAVAFEHVRVHTDAAAAEAAQLLGAQAFTMGHHIYFGRGQLAPGTEHGDRLLRHELTHVAQHARGELAAHGALELVAPSSAPEAEARAAEARPMPPTRPSPPPTVVPVNPAATVATAPIARAPDERAAPGSDDAEAPSAVASEALRLARRGTRSALPYRKELEIRHAITLENIEVYTGREAVQACAMVNAQAFAVGNIIVFASDNPSFEVVTHEVTHVLQQGGHKQQLGSPPVDLAISRDSDRDELEAHEAGRAAAADPAGRVPVGAATRASAEAGARPVLSRLPAPPDCHTFRPGLSIMAPIVKEGYDGNTYTAIKTGWDMGSWERRWQIYDADDRLLYESSYTWPAPTLKIPKDVIARGRAGGANKPWSVWIKVTKTLTPFGGDNRSNFPHSYMRFHVYETWSEYLADPGARAAGPAKPAGDPSKPSAVESPLAKNAGSVTDYGSVVAMHEAYLRTIYDTSAKGLSETAQELVKQGVPQKDVAPWATEARNSLKAKIRDQGSPILKRVFEERNLAKYGDKLGPSYEQLYAKFAKQGLTPDEINAQIIKGSGKANVGFNRWAGRLKFAGRLFLVLDLCLAGVRVYMAPEGQKLQTGLKELARIGGALAGGAAGAEAGVALGAAIGALFAGVGAAPGAIIGGIVGGIGGAILGGWAAEQIVDKLYEMFPPADCKFEGDFEEGVKSQ